MPGGYTSFYQPPRQQTSGSGGTTFNSGSTSPLIGPNPWLDQYQGIIDQMLNFNMFPQLPPDVLAMLGQSKNAALLGSEAEFDKRLSNTVARFYGNNVPRSSIAANAAASVAKDAAADRGAIEADYAGKQIGLQQYAGQGGLSALGAAGGLLGQAGSMFQGGQGQLMSLLSLILPYAEMLGGGSGGGGLTAGRAGGGGGYGGPFGSIAGPGVWPGSGGVGAETFNMQDFISQIMQYLGGGG